MSYYRMNAILKAKSEKLGSDKADRRSPIALFVELISLITAIGTVISASIYSSIFSSFGIDYFAIASLGDLLRDGVKLVVQSLEPAKYILIIIVNVVSSFYIIVFSRPSLYAKLGVNLFNRIIYTISAISLTVCTLNYFDHNRSFGDDIFAVPDITISDANGASSSQIIGSSGAVLLVFIFIWAGILSFIFLNNKAITTLNRKMWSLPGKFWPILWILIMPSIAWAALSVYVKLENSLYNRAFGVPLLPLQYNSYVVFNSDIHQHCTAALINPPAEEETRFTVSAQMIWRGDSTTLIYCKIFQRENTNYNSQVYINNKSFMLTIRGAENLRNVESLRQF